jgi:hypothetical protein
MRGTQSVCSRQGKKGVRIDIDAGVVMRGLEFDVVRCDFVRVVQEGMLAIGVDGEEPGGAEKEEDPRPAVAEGQEYCLDASLGTVGEV